MSRDEFLRGNERLNVLTFSMNMEEISEYVKQAYSEKSRWFEERDEEMMMKMSCGKK